MGDSLTLLLLGPPDLAVRGAPVGLRSAKSKALLCYLATTSGPRTRSELAGLLWGERPDAKARGSLRLALSELRREVGGWLDITRDHVRFRADDGCFVDHRHLMRASSVAQALRLWRGEFLDGVCIDDAPAFAAWLDGERHRVRLLLRDLLVNAAPDGSPQVIRLARIVTALDPYDEEAHRLLMLSLAGAGNRAAALTCYDTLTHRLSTDLGIPPSPETRALTQGLLADGPRRRGGVPVPASSLVGREDEVRRVRELVRRARVVTLIGPGGVGKTRLAIAAASEERGAGKTRLTTADAPEERGVGETRLGVAAASEERGAGKTRLPTADASEERGGGEARLAVAGAFEGVGEVVFVSFAGVRPGVAVTTLARRLGVDLSPSRPALDLLLAALADRPATLLVLDNLEHLPAFDQVIAEILRIAPHVRVLATSRRRPALPGQAVVEVEGLPAPAAEALFAARAAKAQPAFDAGREAASVAAICAATRGLPLAIELAAGLLRAVPCAELARRLGTDGGLLSVAGPAVRPRHACMRTVFETSWSLLGPPEQAALAALSVFGDGCTLAHALDVTGTTPQALVNLVDHSMLHLTPAGRYTVHPLIRQYAAAHLAEDPATEAAVRERHAACYARLLDRYAPALQDASDDEAPRVLGVELDNIRTAWAVSREPAFLDHYWTLCLRLRLYEESAAVVHEQLGRPGDVPYLRARWLRMAATSAYQLARVSEALDLARTSLETLAHPLPTTPAALATATLKAATHQALHRLLPPRRPGPFPPQQVGSLPPQQAGPRPPQQTGPLLPQPADRPLLPFRRVGGPASWLASEEEAQALALVARLAYHQQDVPTMLAASLRQLNAAERATDPALRAEAYANFATIARIAGGRRSATRYGGLADQALAAVPRPTEAANRARLARGIDQLHTGAFEAARRSFTEGRRRTLDPRMAENCAGMLAETALWQGDFARAADLFAETEELAVRRVGGDDIGRHWCLTGRAEALLRLDDVPAEHIAEVLAAARASTDRRRALATELGLRDGPVMHALQDLRLLTATTRLTLRTLTLRTVTHPLTAPAPSLTPTPTPTPAPATSPTSNAPRTAQPHDHPTPLTSGVPFVHDRMAPDAHHLWTPFTRGPVAAVGGRAVAGDVVVVPAFHEGACPAPGSRADRDLLARHAYVEEGMAEVRAGFARALELAAALPPAQPGMLECWAGLAELAWALSAYAPPALHTHPDLLHTNRDQTTTSRFDLDQAALMHAHTDPLRSHPNHAASLRTRDGQDPGLHGHPDHAASLHTRDGQDPGLHGHPDHAASLRARNGQDAGLQAFPDQGALRRLEGGLVRWVGRSPGAGARLGWARGLVLVAAGRVRAAGRVAGRAVGEAERLGVAYDRARAEELVRHLGRVRRW